MRTGIPELDKLIRSQRTVHEAQMIHLSKLAGVSTPPLLLPLTGGGASRDGVSSKGERLKVLLLEAGITRERVEALGEEFGRSIARLHGAGIMHGDLTTSNVIVDGGAISLIDFGLAVHSGRLEDQAVDLQPDQGDTHGSPQQHLKAIHAVAPYGILLGARQEEGGRRAKKLAEIERRGRYARVE